MAQAAFTSVDEYIASQPPFAQGPLECVRNAIRSAVPEAEECISYKMPCYKLRGEGLIHFAGWKRHVSLYLASEKLVAAFKDELAAYVVKKGTISFPLTEPLPLGLIGRIVKLRLKELAVREQARSSNGQ